MKMKHLKTFRRLTLVSCVLIIGIFTVVHSKNIPNGKDPGTPNSPGNNRVPRQISLLKLKDPLDCLSQVICGLNTYPPQKPSVRSNSANDFAYILKASIIKLRTQKPPTTTTTTAAPITSRRTTTRVQLHDDEDEEEYDEDSIENELDYDDRDDDYYNDYNHPRRPPGPPPIPIDRRRLKRSSIFNERRGKESKKDKKAKNKKVKNTPNQIPKRRQRPTIVIEHYEKPATMSPLDRLRVEKDLRAKLLSEAQCANGLIDHSCPFNYQQMLSLISSSLERERTVSYTTNKVLPMVGYLIKSRNYTATLAATFSALEKINNYTIEADKEGKSVDFSHILDEVLNRVTGDNGLRIVDTSNDSASASVWEDDEFDQVLENPYVRKRPAADNYKLDKKKKQDQAKKKVQVSAAENDQSEEDTSEEGLIFDRPRPPPRGPPSSDDVADNSSSEEEEDEHSKVFDEKKKKNFELNKDKLAPPPVFGHIRKSAEDE